MVHDNLSYHTRTLLGVYSAIFTGRKSVPFERVPLNPLAAIDAKMRHLHPPQVQALSRAH